MFFNKTFIKKFSINWYVPVVAIPAAIPATTSSPITPHPPFTFLSIFPMIDGFQISKILKNINAKVLW